MWPLGFVFGYTVNTQYTVKIKNHVSIQAARNKMSYLKSLKPVLLYYQFNAVDCSSF